MLKFNATRVAYISAASAVSIGSATEAKLASFSALPNGWHYGGGQAIRMDVISRAQRMLGIFAEFNIRKTDAFPGASGEVMLTAYTDHDYYELVFAPSGEISLLREVNRVEDFSQAGLDENTAAWQLRELLGDKCITSGCYIRSILTLREMNSKVWHSRIMTEALPSFNESVWIQHHHPFATTLGNFILTREAIPPYSGFFLKMPSQRAVR
jgi:hypothetical protein